MKRLVLEIRASPDFQPGISDAKVTSLTQPGATLRYLIRFNDYLTKPDNWDTHLKSYFGAYSQVKYAFIIEATGVSVFNIGPGGLPVSAGFFYRQVCRKGLAQYEATNGPLIDEFGNRVTF